MRKYIADKQFYKRVLMLATPMVLQNLITNFVSMLDNIMVGQIGTMQMSGVSIVNQYIFIFNITLFGTTVGPSIFGAQFFGKGDHEGQQKTFQFRLIASVLMSVLFMVVFSSVGDRLISLFLTDSNQSAVAQTLVYGRQYMNLMIWGMVPFGISQAYASVIRECGETKIPMYAAASAVGANLFLDYALIFGKFGFPNMGVRGAAIATVIAKVIEGIVVVAWVHTNPERNKYIIGVFRKLRIPAKLMKDMLIKGIPLLLNEFLWVLGMSVMAQCYSVRGLDVVAARNIAGTINNLFSVIFVQTGSCIAIIIGPVLGRSEFKEARDLAGKLITFCTFVGFVLTVLMVPFAFFFPSVYNTEAAVRSLAAYMIVIQALAMPIWAYTNAGYFILRSGGQTGIVFAYDFCSSWLVMIPLAFVIGHYTSINIYWMMVIVTFSEIVKVIIGHYMVKSDIWIRNIVD